MKAIGKLLVIINLFFIVYFTISLDLVNFPDYENQIDAAVNVLRPFVSVFIPIFNIGYTILAFVVLVIILILVASKHPNLSDKDTIANITNIKPAKSGIIRKTLLLGKNIALVWLSWSYGAHYMAFIVFAMVIIGKMFAWAVNSAIEAAKDKAVQMMGEGKV
jgi:hypothetical protein